MGSAAEWLAAFVALLALLTAWHSESRAKSAERATDELSERMTAAQEEAAAALREVHTQIANLAPILKVRWSLTHPSGIRYVLKNIGTADARDVRLTLNGRMHIDGEREVDLLRPDDSTEFRASKRMGVAAPKLTVTWTNSDGTQDHWDCPYPEAAS